MPNFEKPMAELIDLKESDVITASGGCKKCDGKVTSVCDDCIIMV